MTRAALASKRRTSTGACVPLTNRLTSVATATSMTTARGMTAATTAPRTTTARATTARAMAATTAGVTAATTALPIESRPRTTRGRRPHYLCGTNDRNADRGADRTRESPGRRAFTDERRHRKADGEH